jgi:hypothetical protein
MVVVWGIVRLFFSAALFLLVARKIFAGAGDFEATFRVCAYAAAPVVLLWIPLIRSLAVLYIGYLIIVGLQRAQQFDSVKAVLTVLLSIAIGAFLTLALGGPRHWWWGRRFAALV